MTQRSSLKEEEWFQDVTPEEGSKGETDAEEGVEMRTQFNNSTWGYHGIVINKTNSSGRLRHHGTAMVSGRPANSIMILVVSSGERRRWCCGVGSGVGSGVVRPLKSHALQI
ncbi:hypothetical protein NDU88_007978 [Pleurodeles waltl]|uniref:Uncharacterized protein n=1 Tax=Pleurodeles waltl TaxID=8319 RepID=A0AAV7PQE1_PLEWA|nr:hypothetical protein NDU88_007978 [Pleurodeles waltl]